MKRKQIIDELSRYFKPYELVSKAVYERFGDKSWRFFDTELLETLLILRKHILCVPLICNNWQSGGTFAQRGLRENTAPLVWSKTNAGTMYLSGHCLGKAVDLSSAKMAANEMRSAIRAKKDELPYKVRIENGNDAPTWLHIDVMADPNNREKVQIF